METNQTVVVITGMHRSGTSLTTSLLQSSGVFIGDRLMAGGTGNTRGHFEDWDFVDLHRASLTAQSVNREGWTTQTDFTFSGKYLSRAKSLLAARSQHPIWGWKDPRSTLFLDSWQSLIPQVKFIFVYRSPWNVVDSLYRRGDLIFKTKPEIAIQTWISYNRKILNFCNYTSRPWVLLKIEDVIDNPLLIINEINRELDLDLPSPENLYERSLFNNKKVDLYGRKTIQKYYPEAIQLYGQLHQQATKIEPSSVKVARRHLQLRWLWQNWLHKPVAKMRAVRLWWQLNQLMTNIARQK